MNLTLSVIMGSGLGFICLIFVVKWLDMKELKCARIVKS